MGNFSRAIGREFGKYAAAGAWSELLGSMASPAFTTAGGATIGGLLGGVGESFGAGKGTAASGAGLGAALGMGASAVGKPLGLASAFFTPTKTKDDYQQEHRSGERGIGRVLKHLFVPGHAEYDLGKRLGSSIQDYDSTPKDKEDEDEKEK